MFFLHGLLFASWTAHIPAVQQAVGAGNGELGTALLGAPIGSVLAMVAVGRLIPRFGSRVVVLVSAVGYSLAGLTVGLTGDLIGLFVALFLWGAFQGALDVAMNAHGTEVEHAHGGAIMSAFHGFWSIGALAGAVIGAACAGLGVGLDVQLLPLGLLAILATLVLGRWLLPPERATPEPRGTRPRAAFTIPTKALLLGAVAFACMLCEGATADWSAVHLTTDLGATAAIAGLAYAAYACAMVVVRMLAARIFRRFAPSKIIPPLALVAAAGMTVGLVSGSLPVIIAGFALLGVGLATIVPTAFTAASRLPGGKPGASIAQVSALGWAGFVCGPPLIGHLSELTGLTLALGVVPLLAVVIAVMIRFGRLFPDAPITATPDGDPTAADVVGAER